MDDLKSRVDALNSFIQLDDEATKITQERLEFLGLSGAKLRDYQLFGVNWLISSYSRKREQQGCILGDEMGLGKTIQALSLLLYTKKEKKSNGPVLILAPLSVLANWRTEMEKWLPSVKFVVYVGNKESRLELRDSLLPLLKIKHSNWKNDEEAFDVLLTSYELCLKDSSFLKRFNWEVLVVDEAHRLKNYKSLLYSALCEFNISFKLLLTGTPVQNNLSEIYSLLSFICPDIFQLDDAAEFTQYFQLTDQSGGKVTELVKLLKPFILRREKDEVMKCLPKKSEVVLFTAMSQVQKKLYKAILLKDFGAFGSELPQRSRLMNILMQLRKCCNHPYIFPGIEPEPFEIGDHLITASGKLSILDKLLAFLKASGHRVLMFSQFTSMLDILQDYMTYKGYTYERLDGSVRGEERYLAVNNFNESDSTFVFLLSTRAGGQGLNLMTADTVIFIDNDFNPQNDLQAAARAHRIGQTRPVKIIRLVSKFTVEEIILKRVADKLKLTEAILEGGQLSHSENSAKFANELPNILKFGLHDLLNSDESSLEDQDFTSILGGSLNGEWLTKENEVTEETATEDEELEDNIYRFEGRDYAKDNNEKDKAAFDVLSADFAAQNVGAGRTRRGEKGEITNPVTLDNLPKRARKKMSEEEKERRRVLREEKAAIKAKLLEDERQRKLQESLKKREKFWRQNSYETMNISDNESSSDEDGSGFGDDDDDDDNTSMRKNMQIEYIVGDVLQPANVGSRDAIIIHCVDTSGNWGKGGLFSAITARSLMPEAQYELAGKMKDLNLGDAHLIPIDDRMSRESGRDWVALIVAQKRDRNNRMTPINMSSLAKGMERIKKLAKKTKASVHLPRIGHNMPNFNWYGVERLIRKLFISNGIPTSIYYFPRSRNRSSNPRRKQEDEQDSASDVAQKKSKIEVEQKDVGEELLSIFTGMSFYLHNFEDQEKREITRYIIAYDGEVIQNIDEATNYVIYKEESELAPLPDDVSSLKKMTVDRLKECIAAGKLLDEK